MNIKKVSLSLLVLTIIFSISCKKEEINQAPTIPPAGTMVIEFGNFVGSNKSGQVDGSVVVTKTNWFYSATSVGFWNIIIGTTFAVPVAAFKSSFNQTPQKINENTWEWKYSVDGFTSQYSARLVGEIQSSEVKWEMFVSKAGVDSFDEFLWFNGTSALDGESGEWTLYHSASFPEKTVEIDWQKEGEQIGNIKYTYVRELNDLRETENFYGSYLIYGLQDELYDAFVNIHAFNEQEENFADSFIEWSRDDYSGRVKAEHFFNDNNWHCWDSSGNDIDCN